MAADKRAEVYLEGREVERGYWGCVYGHVPRFLGSPPSPCTCGDMRHVTLSGTLVAYDSLFREDSVTEWKIYVLSLYDGAYVHDVPTGASVGSGNDRRTGDGPATDIVLKRDAAVAWIVRSVSTPGVLQVWISDARGLRMAASATDIAPGSLRLAGSFVSWSEGGARRSSGIY